MKKKVLTFLLIPILGFISFQSCEKEKEGENERKVSSHGSSESHNNGQNCMSCHKSGGSGEGWFTLAGSVYDSTKANPLPNATIRLYSGPNGSGTLAATVEVDNRGNMYTTESINFGAGLYPSVEGSSSTQYMSTTIASGECSSCHGVTTDKIWTK